MSSTTIQTMFGGPRPFAAALASAAPAMDSGTPSAATAATTSHLNTRMASYSFHRDPRWPHVRPRFTGDGVAQGRPGLLRQRLEPPRPPPGVAPPHPASGRRLDQGASCIVPRPAVEKHW